MACASGASSTDYSSEAAKAYNEGNYVAAIEAYSKDIKINRNRYSYLFRGWAYLYEGYGQKAKDDFTKALRLQPNYVNAKIASMTVAGPRNAVDAFARGFRANYQKKYDLAIEEYTQAILLFPTYKAAYAYRGMSHFNKGTQFFDQAEADCNEAINIDPEYQLPYVVLGNIYRSRGNYNDAMSYYNTALRIDERYEYAQRRKKSLEDYLASQDVQREAQRYFALANTARDRNDYANAIVNYRKALELIPNYTAAKNNLKAVWDRRIAENQSLYPAPFEGIWHYQGQSEKVERSGVGINPSTRRRDDRYEERFYIEIPGDTIIYVFTGSNYTRTRYYYRPQNNNYHYSTPRTKRREETTGTFYYNGNTIELEEGITFQLNVFSKISPEMRNMFIQSFNSLPSYY